MKPKDIEKIIVKYLTNEADSNDLDDLSDWISDSKNEKYFESYVKTHYQLRVAMNEPDIETIKKNLSKKIKKDKNPFHKYKNKSVLKYAALVAVLLSVGYWYKWSNTINTNENEIPTSNILISKEASITIKLDDGTLKVINPKEVKQIKDKNGNLIGNQSQTELSYLETSNPEKLVYNTLNIPYGKKFNLILSDGTNVYLNSGTSIRYPVKFLKGLNREVFIRGEAYFDVTKDKEHPFIVHADDINVRVLGTKFNISHYAENNNSNTVLVEGSVELYNKGEDNEKTNNSTMLKPGYKAEWDKSSNDISIENVDTRIYTAWIDGKLIFRNTTFKQIRQTLERQYNVVIKNSNKELEVQLFDATFDVENINEIIETFSRSYAIQYEIVNNEVLIH
ncbi:FecR family protein [Flavivirga algicola]|uniref:FecR family protein n=1 Tax=Flavivirga algicola TaxID=2729136 RepID=A0ABX1RXG8_9FLAO|nr:FecR domain-containing protein [Flavivirga algicola]NMH86899.1 FecR family protein [Flavivirga algicola]